MNIGLIDGLRNGRRRLLSSRAILWPYALRRSHGLRFIGHVVGEYEHGFVAMREYRSDVVG